MTLAKNKGDKMSAPICVKDLQACKSFYRMPQGENFFIIL